MENEFLERAEQLRSDPSVHYNCAQAVLIPLAGNCGISEEQAAALCAHFGGGMKVGTVCGAIAAGAMAIGLMGGTNEQYREYMQSMTGNHDGVFTCRELLAAMREKGQDQKTHCDGMVYESLEQVLRVMGLSS